MRLSKVLYFLFRHFLTILNKLLPKSEKVIVQGFPNNEGSAIEVYNYIATKKTLPVFFVIDKRLMNHPGELLIRPQLLEKSSLRFFYHYLTAKYIFFTHGSTLNSFSNKQIAVNIWHGLCYKPVGVLIGNRPIKVDLTVATSEFTKPMFMKSFGVPYQQVVGSGYPRNDIMIREKPRKIYYKQKLKLTSFNKIMIWLPTYRKAVVGEERSDGREIGNPFYISNFDISLFNSILEKHNVLCMVKPHPMAPIYDNQQGQSHLKFIDDQWLSDNGLTIYHLAAASDLLISDVSSVIADYMMMDQPVVCVNEDFEEYKRTRGFYFDDIENWIPSRVCRSAEEFFQYLGSILETGVDPYEEQRRKIKKFFFDHDDGKSAERVVEAALSLVKP